MNILSPSLLSANFSNFEKELQDITNHLNRVIIQIKECESKAGVEINPATPIS